ncbi:MAG TPA: extracellular solute-binding protein [Candidatus Methylomirabilis sp.]|nr:extracellular solute-binding protein [Candidatus Methylomirabilis sp.]
MRHASRWIVVVVLILALGWALRPVSADVKLTLWRLKTYIPPADKILDTNAQECAKQIGADVQIQTYTFDDMWTKYTAAIESKTLPDVAELDAVGPARLANLGRLSDVSDLVGAVTKDLGELLPNAEGAVKFSGKFYAVPHYAIPLLLFYRKDLVEKVGAQPPDTWDAINEISVKVKKAGLQEFPQGFPWNRTGDGYDPAMSLLWSYGAAWVDKSGKYVGMPKDKALQALKVVTPPYLTEKTSAFDYLSWSGSGNNEAFMAGKITFTPNGPSILFQEDSTMHPLRKDTAIKIMPRGPAGRNLALTFVMNWGIPVDGKQQKEARALVACIMSKNRFTAYMTGSFQQAVPLFKTLIGHNYWNNADGKIIVETVKLGHPVGWPGPTTPAAAEVISSNVLTDMMTRVIVDKVAPEKAVEEADKRIKEIYDRLSPK